MTMKKPENPAFVLGMFETGLGVARSLGMTGIKVFGLDHKKDIGFYSRFVKAIRCPHPAMDNENFIDFLAEKAKKLKAKPVLFITSDDFLKPVSENREKLSQYFYFNLPHDRLLQQISDKYNQFKLARQAGIDVPETVLVYQDFNDENEIRKFRFPVIIKAKDVTTWRKKISATQKGFIAQSAADLLPVLDQIRNSGVEAVIQEIIPGPDTNHFKFCGYYDSQGSLVAGFTLQKLRQNPVRFGVGSLVQSIDYKELFETGDRLFRNIGYKGIGSAEFKLDANNQQLKLIEINPRYWQQNFLSTCCGINFPALDYSCSIGDAPENQLHFKTHVKWVNIYMDFDSFNTYRKEKSITSGQWIKSLKGKKVFSDWWYKDPLPGFYEIRFGLRLFKIFPFMLKKIKKKFHRKNTD